KYDKDVLVETWVTPPPDYAEKVKELQGKERDAFFRKWATQRAQYRVVHGVYILVCTNPTYLYVEITPKGRPALDTQPRDRIRAALISEFRDERFDEGLLAAVKVVEEKLAKAAKASEK